MAARDVFSAEQQARLGVDANGRVVGGGAGGCAAACGPDGGCGVNAACDDACGTGGQASMLVYKGQGQGDYVQETQYQFVGTGHGDFTPKAAGYFTWYCCGGVSAALALLVLLLVLLWPVGPGPTTSTPLYDCNEGFGTWQQHWTMGKKAWCCEKTGKGCPPPAPLPPAPRPPPPPQPAPPIVTPAPPGFCNQGGVSEWSSEKRAFCCEHFKNGCPGTPAPAPVQPPYDCNAGFGNWQAGWSVGKKAFCCKSVGKGCPPGGGCATTSAPYDCFAGFNNWQAGWSVAKKAWCCTNTGKGCNAAPGCN